MSSESLHENAETLGAQVIDTHRAIVSLMEELEAVDWYSQRAKATADPSLRAILEHTRDEWGGRAAGARGGGRRGGAGGAGRRGAGRGAGGPSAGSEAE